MWVPLVVLAVFATIGGLVGIGPAFTGSGHLGGKLNIVTWLEPVIWNPATKHFRGETVEQSLEEQGARRVAGSPLPTTSEPVAAGSHAGNEGEEPTPYGDTGFNLAVAIATAVHSHRLAEWIFIVISLAVAGAGMLLGAFFYLWRPALADIWAARLAPLYRASYNKYWIDEFYGWAITRRTMDLARGVFKFDSNVVDGAVNGTAWLTRLSSKITGGTDKYFVDGLVNAIADFVVRLMSPIVRAAQTGLTANYALVMVIGLLLAVAFYLVKMF
jgi:NADH-quinone oxidoreductase subunit L